jgi:hypothetical protein
MPRFKTLEATLNPSLLFSTNAARYVQVSEVYILKLKHIYVEPVADSFEALKRTMRVVCILAAIVGTTVILGSPLVPSTGFFPVRKCIEN